MSTVTQDRIAVVSLPEGATAYFLCANTLPVSEQLFDRIHRSEQQVHMVRHNDPTDKFGTRAVVMMQYRLQDLSLYASFQQALAITLIQPVLELTREFTVVGGQGGVIPRLRMF